MFPSHDGDDVDELRDDDEGRQLLRYDVLDTKAKADGKRKLAISKVCHRGYLEKSNLHFCRSCMRYIIILNSLSLIQQKAIISWQHE